MVAIACQHGAITTHDEINVFRKNLIELGLLA